MAHVMPSGSQVLLCNCEYAQVLPKGTKEAVRKALTHCPATFQEVADLCELSARRDPRLQQLASTGPLTILACHPRAVRWLFAAGGASLDGATTRFLNLRVRDAGEVVACLLDQNSSPVEAMGIDDMQTPAGDLPAKSTAGTGVESAAVSTTREARPAWLPWFPVIDFDLCTNCMQCLSFCLFGVYGVDEHQRVRVQSPEQCKTNCPACSRVCPEAAIIFPKHKSGPINGEAVSDADSRREKIKIDVSALLGGDVYSVLRERSERAKARFSKDRDCDTALKERQKCLARLIELGDIPPEVLMSLPSWEEIQRKGEQARATAQAALKRGADTTS